MNNNYFSLRDNIRHLSVGVSFFAAFLINSDIAYGFAFSWLIIIGILGNVRRIPGNDTFECFVRMTLYFLPYCIPSMFLNNHSTNNKGLTWVLLGIVIGIIGILINKKQIEIFLSEEFVAATKKQDSIRYVFIVYNLIGAAICEELYFRKFIITVFYEYKQIAVLFSSIYFMLSHYILMWGDSFKRNDFITQIIIGLISGMIYIVSNSIVTCIILHLIMNLPSIILQIKCYKRHYLKVEYYDKLFADDCEDDLPI